MSCCLRIFLLFLYPLLFFGVLACGSSPENKLPEKPVVISGLIPSRPVSPDVKPDVKPDANPDIKSDVKKVTESDPNKVNETDAAVQKHEMSKSQVNVSQNAADNLSEVMDKAALKEEALYNSEGKIDPFASLVMTEEAEPLAEKPGESEGPPRILTPLEKLDFSQLRLVAVVQAEAGDVAMVEETGGKGYIVKIGTYIGKNNGKVVEIYNDRIVIQEQVKNFKGNLVTRSQEMKLHKPDNEG